MPACSFCLEYSDRRLKRPSSLEELVEQLGSDYQNYATPQEEDNETFAVHIAMVPEHSLSGDGATLACPPGSMMVGPNMREAP